MATATAPDQHHDVIIAGDLTTPGDRSLRIALEIEHYRSLGASVGLFHAGSGIPQRRLSAELAASVRRGRAEPVIAPTAHTSRLLILHAPSELRTVAADLSAFDTRKLVVVAYGADDYDLTATPPSFESQQWAAVSAAVRKLARAGASLARGHWSPPAPPARSDNGDRPSRPPAAIGWLVANAASLPVIDHDPYELYAVSLDGSRPPLLDDSRFIDLSRPDVAPSRLLDRLVGLAFFPGPDTAQDIPDAILLSAMDRGIPVALPNELERRFGTGPIYCQEGDATGRLIDAIGDVAPSATGGTPAKPRSSSLPVVRGTLTPAGQGEDAPVRPVMFVVGGSTGVGHTARLLAIARRMQPEVPVVFVCQAHTVSTIERLGHLAEHIPSASYVGGNVEVWNDWLRHRLDQLLDDYDPSLVVFDGNHLYPGMAGAIAARPDCRFAWVRRGLWGKTVSPYMANAIWCDLIIEPGELPGQPDDGITARRKAEVLKVDPIQLLDAHELLSRTEACKVLGLDPKLPAVIVQLGANAVRETASILHEVIGHLRRYPKLQICVAEFAGLDTALGYFPGVTCVRGFPLSQYLRAFDFAISAAGYNTVHEAISFDLPTIFIPNRDPSMDDQAGRASFAQDRGAAFEIDADDLGDLPNLVQLLLEPKGRDFLSQNGRKLRRPNGALAAAGALESLVG